MPLTYRLNRTGEIKQPHSICPDQMTRPYGRTPQTSGPECIMRLCGLGRSGNLGSLACKRRISIQRVTKALATSKKTASVFLFLPNFLVFRSKMQANHKDVLDIGRSLNYSYRISTCFLSVCIILDNRIFTNNLPIVSNKLIC